MTPEYINEVDDPVTQIPKLTNRLDRIQQSLNGLEEEMRAVEASTKELINSIDFASQQLKKIEKKPKATTVEGLSAGGPAITLEDFKAHIDKILQSSLETVSNKISDKILNMLQELKTLQGTAREVKIQEIKDAAASEMVDISSLYMHEEVQSNLGEVGVDEKESKGIDSSLERLRKLRGSKPKSEET